MLDNFLEKKMKKDTRGIPISCSFFWAYKTNLLQKALAHLGVNALLFLCVNVVFVL